MNHTTILKGEFQLKHKRFWHHLYFHYQCANCNYPTTQELTIYTIPLELGVFRELSPGSSILALPLYQSWDSHAYAANQLVITMNILLIIYEYIKAQLRRLLSFFRFLKSQDLEEKRVAYWNWLQISRVPLSNLIYLFSLFARSLFHQTLRQAHTNRLWRKKKNYIISISHHQSLFFLSFFQLKK